MYNILCSFFSLFFLIHSYDASGLQGDREWFCQSTRRAANGIVITLRLDRHKCPAWSRKQPECEPFMWNAPLARNVQSPAQGETHHGLVVDC